MPRKLDPSSRIRYTGIIIYLAFLVIILAVLPVQTPFVTLIALLAACGGAFYALSWAFIADASYKIALTLPYPSDQLSLAVPIAVERINSAQRFCWITRQIDRNSGHFELKIPDGLGIYSQTMSIDIQEAGEDNAQLRVFCSLSHAFTDFGMTHRTTEKFLGHLRAAIVSGADRGLIPRI